MDVGTPCFVRRQATNDTDAQQLLQHGPHGVTFVGVERSERRRTAETWNSFQVRDHTLGTH